MLALLYTIVTIAAVLPIIFIKQYINTGAYHYMLLALMMYIILLAAYVQIFRTKQISTAYPLIQIIQMLFVTVVGIILYNEKINTYNTIGVILGIVVVYLLSA